MNSPNSKENQASSSGRKESIRQAFLAVASGRKKGLGASLQRLFLYLGSFPYRWAIGLRNLAYSCNWLKVHEVSAKVVSVGNLTVGGTGKTPAVEWIARFYRQHDLQVAIISRGYGKGTDGLNDEARLLYDNLPDVPHLQDKDRVKAAEIAIEELESELLILDDGFQHRRLARNLDLVLIDATQPWGHGYLLPRGLLREPISSLRRASAIILTRCDQVTPQSLETTRQSISRIASTIPLIETSHVPYDLIDSDGQSQSLAMLKDRPILAFCGLGNPAAFQQTLNHLGARPLGFRTFPDHHPYSANDVQELKRWAEETGEKDLLLITTQKDLVKLRINAIGDTPLLAVRIGLEILKGQEDLEQLLLKMIH